MKSYVKDVVKIGDYVKYKPNKESYTVFEVESGFCKKQVYKPVETKVPWRVMYVNDDGVSLIAAASVGQLTLRGSKGYKSAKQTLNCLCDAYVNPRWAISGRSIGCLDPEATPVINHPIEYHYVCRHMMEWWHELRDYEHREECYWLTEHEMLSKECIWLAARGFSSAGEFIFSVMRLGTLGADQHEILQIASREGILDETKTNGVLPVIQLKPDVVVIDGDGSEKNPYALG